MFHSDCGFGKDSLPGPDGSGAISRVPCVAVNEVLTDSGARRRAARLALMQVRTLRIGYDAVLTGPHASGVATAAGELLAALSQAAPSQEFVAFTHSTTGVQSPDRPNVERVTPWAAACGVLGRIYWQQSRARHDARRYDLDVYHGATYVVPPRIGVPTIVSVYDSIALDYPALLPRIDAAYLRWALPHGTWRATRIVVPSQHVRNRLLARLGLAPGRVRVVPLGVAEAFRPLPPEEVEKRLQLVGGQVPFDRPFFLCAGSVDRRKNLLTAIQALARMRGGRFSPALVIAGRPGNDSGTIRAAARAFGLEDRVRFVGRVGPRELAALYNAASGLLYPSIEEGFALPPLEAMACGTPALVSDADAVKETVGDAAVVLPRDDAGAWASAMGALLGSQGLREELIGKGFARAAGFTWKPVAERMLDLYAEAADV